MIQEKTREELLVEIQILRERLEEAEAILGAIHYDEIDAVVVLGPEGYRVYLLNRDSRTCRFLVETLSEGTVLTTADRSIFCCNSRFAEMVGSSVERIPGSSMLSFVPEEEHCRFNSLFDEAQKGSCKGEIHLKSGAEELLPVNLSINPLQMEGTSGFCLVLSDLSEQKRHEEIIAGHEEIIAGKRRELEVKNLHLEELNTALKVLLNQRDLVKSEFEEYIFSNVKTLVFPYLEKLRKTNLTDQQATYCQVIETHMNEIISPFVRKLSRAFSALTATEIRVAGLIKEGKTAKEIAAILQVSENTVLVHRHRIRTKLGLKETKINLASHLQSFSTREES